MGTSTLHLCLLQYFITDCTIESTEKFPMCFFYIFSRGFENLNLFRSNNTFAKSAKFHIKLGKFDTLCIALVNLHLRMYSYVNSFFYNESMKFSQSCTNLFKNS